MSESILQRIQRTLGKGNLPLWRYTPGGAVWRVSPSHPDVLVGEERDLTAKHTRFFCLDKKSGRVRWEERAYGEEWWIGIEAMNHDVLFLHRFLQPDMPEHKSIIAVDLGTGNELWRNDDVVVHQVFEKTILAYRPTLHGKEEIELDARTGAVVNSDSSGRQVPEGFDVDVHYPATVIDPMDELPEFANVWKNLSSGNRLVSPVEVVNLGSCIVAAFYVYISPPEDSPPRYRQEIVVGTPSGRMIIKETIVEDTPAIVPEAFFVQAGAVFFVATRNTLTSVRLPGKE